jgi:hypothetical protein
LQSQLDALEPLCKRIFSEKISTRVKVRPELEKALKLAYDIKEAAPDQEVILTVHERLARNAAELITSPASSRTPASSSNSSPALSPASTTPTARARCSSPSWPLPPSSTATTSGRRPCSRIATANGHVALGDARAWTGLEGRRYSGWR